jgi:hypothetical protein
MLFVLLAKPKLFPSLLHQQLRETLSRMARAVASASTSASSRAWAAQLQGHREVLDDLETTSRQHKAALKRRLETALLLGGRAGAGGSGPDSAADALMRERSSLLGSHKAIGVWKGPMRDEWRRCWHSVVIVASSHSMLSCSPCACLRRLQTLPWSRLCRPTTRS